MTLTVPPKAPTIEDFEELNLQPGAIGGWLVRGYRAGAYEPLCGLADDEALLEFFAGQLGLPAPQLADALNGHPQPLSVRPQALLGDLNNHPAVFLIGPHPDTWFDDGRLVDPTGVPVILRESTWSAIVDALQPVVEMLTAYRDRPDTGIVDEFWRVENADRVTLRVGQLRALVAASGLTIPETQAPPSPQQEKGPAATQPEAAPPAPPAGEPRGAWPELSRCTCGSGFGEGHIVGCPMFEEPF